MDVTEIGRLLAAGGAEPRLWRGRPAPGQPGAPARTTGDPRHPEGYTVVPSQRAPRLLVPAGSRRLATAVAGAANQPTSWPSRLRQYGTRACFAAGVGELLFRDRLVPAVPATLARHLAEVLDQPVRIGLRLGPPRANQKPVLVLLDPAATLVGYAKVAVNPLTRRLLAVERAALVELAEVELRSLAVPRVRYAGRWGEADLLVVSALPVRRARSAATGRAAPLVAAAAAEVARVRATTVTALSVSGYLRQLAGRVAALPADRHRVLLGDILARAVASDPQLEYGSWHGDWFPGNQAVAGGRLLVWDWERHATGVPVGFDALHHAFMSEFLVRRRPLTESASRMAAAAQRLLSPLGVPAGHASAVVALYLVEIATRFREDGNTAADDRLCQPAQWLPPALARLGGSWADDLDRQSRRA